MIPTHCPICQSILSNRHRTYYCRVDNFHYEFISYLNYSVETALFVIPEESFKIVNFYFDDYPNKTKIGKYNGNILEFFIDIEGTILINENSIKRILSLKAFI